MPNPATPVPAHEIVVAPVPGEPGRDVIRDQCFAVRIAVFIDEQGFSLAEEIDSADPTATHILLRGTDAARTPMGTIRAVRPPGKPYYKLTRLAVLKDYRQYGFGRALVQALHDWVRADASERAAATDAAASSGSKPTPTPTPTPTTAPDPDRDQEHAPTPGDPAPNSVRAAASAPVSVPAPVSALAPTPAPEARAAVVVCHSQIPVKSFYARFGYVEEGPEFDEDGAPHQKMVLRLAL